MKASLAALSVLVAVSLIMIASAPVSAFEQMDGVTMTFSPGEMDGGSNVHMVVTLHNYNNRSLTVTTLTVQIYEGMMWGSMDKYAMYHINPADGIVPANGSKEFALDGTAPNYMGTCSVIVTIGGNFEGDANDSIGLLSAYTTIQPGIGPSLMGVGLIIIVALGVLIGVVVLVFILSGKKRTPPAYQRTCPGCGAPLVPGSTFCTRCGRKL